LNYTYKRELCFNIDLNLFQKNLIFTKGVGINSSLVVLVWRDEDGQADMVTLGDLTPAEYTYNI
jgi:hypothetical protein